MRFLKFLLEEIWTPVNIRFGVVYGFFAQVKFLLELVLILGGLYFIWFGTKPSNKFLLLIFGAIFISAAGIGDILIRYNIPQKIAEKNNKLNPQIDKINLILEKLNDLERKIL